MARSKYLVELVLTHRIVVDAKTQVEAVQYAITDLKYNSVKHLQRTCSDEYELVSIVHKSTEKGGEI